jgi:hypothetical protein
MLGNQADTVGNAEDTVGSSPGRCGAAAPESCAYTTGSIAA